MPGFLFLHSLFIERGRLETVWQVHPTASSVQCTHAILRANVCETSLQACCLRKASGIVVDHREHVYCHHVLRMECRARTSCWRRSCGSLGTIRTCTSTPTLCCGR